MRKAAVLYAVRQLPESHRFFWAGTRIHNHESTAPLSWAKIFRYYLPLPLVYAVSMYRFARDDMDYFNETLSPQWP